MMKGEEKMKTIAAYEDGFVWSDFKDTFFFWARIFEHEGQLT